MYNVHVHAKSDPRVFTTPLCRSANACTMTRLCAEMTSVGQAVRVPLAQIKMCRVGWRQ